MEEEGEGAEGSGESALRGELSAVAAMEQAQAEGLTLVHAANATGFKHVTLQGWNWTRFVARIQEKDRYCYLGSFRSAEAAALAVARHLTKPD
eukprot:4332465-Prymnesium_polylepis.1